MKRTKCETSINNEKMIMMKEGDSCKELEGMTMYSFRIIDWQKKSFLDFTISQNNH
jgi:hypothetical protein